jgi:hypothetical protein
MDASAVSRTLSLIPERVARVQSGSAFDPATPGTCAHPERVAYLAQFLEWLGPLRALSKDDQRVFGFMTPYGKPAGDPIEEDAEHEPEPERPDADRLQLFS